MKNGSETEEQDTPGKVDRKSEAWLLLAESSSVDPVVSSDHISSTALFSGHL